MFWKKNSINLIEPRVMVSASKKEAIIVTHTYTSKKMRKMTFDVLSAK